MKQFNENPNTKLMKFHKEHGIIGSAQLTMHCTTDGDLALDLLSEVRRLKKPCLMQQVKDGYGTRAVLFVKEVLDEKTLKAWRALDKEASGYEE